MNIKKALGMGVAVAAIVISMLVPQNDFLTVAGVRTVGVLVAFLVMLVTEALPVVVTSLLFCGLMPLLGVTESLGGALVGYSQPIVFFTLASFGIAAALTSIPLSKRLLRALLRAFGRDINTVLFAIMTATALFSSLVSNVPTCAIFMAISLDFLEMYDDEEDRRRTGRAFMIAIPVASMIGGMMTPAGSSVNLIAMTQLEELTGSTITFVQWMCVGIPLTVVMVPLAWWLCVRCYRPVNLTQTAIKTFTDQMDIPEKVGTKEKKVVVLLVVMLALWIASSWVSAINVMVVAILGCCILFLPGMEVLEVNTFLCNNSWDAFFLVGTVLSISTAMIDNGVSDCIAGLIPTLHVATPLLIAFTALLIFCSLIVIPVATSLIPILAPALVSLANNAGTAPALLLMTAAVCACNCYLLPLDTVPLITYGKGYYAMTDMARSTLWMQIALVILSALWLPLVGKLVGLY